MVFDFLRGEFIDVISWTDDSRDTMVWRFERRGNAIKYGAKLTVREGQAAVFIHEGQLADIFSPGLYELETNNMPVLTSLQHWDHGFKSPFQSEIYFVNTTRFNDQKWGTKNPIIARDPEFGAVRLRAYGSYSMRVADPARFMTEIVGTDGEFTADEISFQIRNVIVQEFSRVIAASGIPVLDMAANTADLGKIVTDAIAAKIADYGLVLPEFYIENISLPDEVEKVLDKRTSIGIVGDLDKYMQFNAAESLANPATGAGSAMGAGMAAGLGIGLARNIGPWGTAPAHATPQASSPTAPTTTGTAPPPLPAAQKLWHLAVDGAATGPYDESGLKSLLATGKLTGATLVWSTGMAGWKSAAETELAHLIRDLPPPLPPQPPLGQ
jgi:membrane protease subunit (stomatin/prohibitin family)